MFNLNEILQAIAPLNEEAAELARQRQNALVKPMGSLGRLEELSIQVAGITGQLHNVVEKKRLFLFGADNGVYEEGICGSPQSFTTLLMSFYGADMNCAINVICKHGGVDLKIVDMGVTGELEYTGIDNRRLMNGTRNFCKEPAMPPEIVLKAIQTGFDYVTCAKEQGYQILGNGEVGMGNTTTATACIMAALGLTDVQHVVGRGAGLTDAAFATKQQVVARGLAKHHPRQDDALDILSKLGGLDIAAIVGVYIGAAYHRLPVVIDGVISIAAALLAATLNPLIRDYMIPSHASEEPAYGLAAQRLGLAPILNLGMRLGEGTGCPIAMGVVETALAVMNRMSTFEEVSLASAYRSELKMK